MNGIRRIDEKWSKSSHLFYVDDGPVKPGAKTRKFNVFNLRHVLVAHVKWFGAWKKYCFFPLDSMLFDGNCMREIAEYCDLVTKEHKAGLYSVKFEKNRLKERRLRRIAELQKKKEKGLTNNQNQDTIDLEIEKEIKGLSVPENGLVEGCDAPDLGD